MLQISYEMHSGCFADGKLFSNSSNKVEKYKCYGILHTIFFMQVQCYCIYGIRYVLIKVYLWIIQLYCKFKRWISLEKQIRIFELNKSMELINFKKLKLQPFHFCAIRSLVIRIRYWWSASLFVVFMLEKFSGAVDIYM